MKLRKYAPGVMAVFCLSMALSGTAKAGTVTLGDPAKSGTGNCDPFGCPAFFGLGTYEQVYSSAAFAGPVSINDITFFDTMVQNGGLPAGGTYTLELSYTSSAMDGLNLGDPTADISSGLETFFTGTLPALSSSELTFSGTPFSYNPADGNLLLTVTVTHGVDGSPYLYLDQSELQAQTTNAYDGSYDGSPISGGNDIGGLVTQFTYTAANSGPGTGPGPSSSVPEPNSLMLVFAGIGLVGLAAARKIRPAEARKPE
jgi:PEP-CTERM motif